jgi:ribonuclease HII
LTDSKQLKKKDREQLQEEIKGAALAWAVAEVSHEEIDEINILNASFKAMHLALDQLEVVPEFLLIDGNRFTTYREIEHQCIVKGDSKYLSIAAASILAKTYRDKLMAELSDQYPGYGWESNMGYPTIQHRNGIRLLGITPYHRRSFQLLPAQLELFER